MLLRNAQEMYLENVSIDAVACGGDGNLSPLVGRRAEPLQP